MVLAAQTLCIGGISVQKGPGHRLPAGLGAKVRYQYPSTRTMIYPHPRKGVGIRASDTQLVEGQQQAADVIDYQARIPHYSSPESLRDQCMTGPESLAIAMRDSVTKNLIRAKARADE